MWKRVKLNRHFWTINKALVLGLIGGFAFLMLEIRYEHRGVLADERTAWIPIIYSGTALILGSFSLWRWDRGGRQLLAILFTASVIVGLLGIWFHTGGHLLQTLSFVGEGVGLLFKPADAKASESFAALPPLLAPLAFCGLGAFGLLACFHQRTAPRPE